MSLYEFVNELQTIYYPDRPARTRPEKMLAMFRRGGSFRGAVHAFKPTAEEKVDVWLLLDKGRPVAAVGRDNDVILVGEAAVRRAEELSQMSFVRLKDTLFETVLSEAQNTEAMIRAEA